MKEGANPLLAGKAWRMFGNFLRKRGLRVTEPRRIICDHVVRRTGHFTAEDVAAELTRAGSSRVSRATVYQTLPLMVRAGILRELPEAGRQVHYEHALGLAEHEHLICERCGRFIEFVDPQIHARIRRACRDADFREHAHRITILGVCRDCRDAEC